MSHQLTPHTTGATYCRHCGFNLHALPENRCPECGHDFDPSRPRSYAAHAWTYKLRHWLRRLLICTMLLILCLSAAVWWLHHAWRTEQDTISYLRSVDVEVTTARRGPPALQRLLGQRWGYLLDRAITINGFGVTLDDAQVARIATLAHLTSLDLCNSNVTDAGIEPLTELSHLEFLDLHCSLITNQAIPKIMHIRTLKYLCLDGTAIDDDGLKLIGTTKLEKLELFQTKVTAAGIADLDHRHPEIAIYWSSTHPKWIGSGPAPFRLIIGTIPPNTDAAIGWGMDSHDISLICSALNRSMQRDGSVGAIAAPDFSHISRHSGYVCAILVSKGPDEFELRVQSRLPWDLQTWRFPDILVEDMARPGWREPPWKFKPGDHRIHIRIKPGPRVLKSIPPDPPDI